MTLARGCRKAALPALERQHMRHATLIRHGYCHVGPTTCSATVFPCSQELDPDVFGEELLEPAYADADRIAAMLVTASKATA